LLHAGEEERRAAFEVLLPAALRLASDAVAHSLVKRLFDVGTVDQRRRLVEELLPELVPMSKRTHGCRVVQKAVECAPRDSQQLIAAELEKDVVGCIESMHGNHVIQRCIEQMSPESVCFVVSAAERWAEELASHKYGCRVIQRLYEHCTPYQLRVVHEKIMDCAARLSQDPYGNYVVQQLLEQGSAGDKRRIMGIAQERLVEFSTHWCASNVVEKCFEAAATGNHAHELQEERRALFCALLGSASDFGSPLRLLAADKYGRYIVQCAVRCYRGQERALLRQLLRQRGCAIDL
jgi:pumilio RNA-binding family